MPPIMRLHPTLTAERILEAVELAMGDLSNPGFCIACGGECDGVDARHYECELCGERKVYGAEELLLRFT